MMQRPARRLRSAAMVTVALLGLTLTAFVPAGGSQQVPGVGEQDLYNFEHVFNLNFEEHLPAGPDTAVGSDLEFFTSTVPYRDYGTGQLLDADGQPLEAGTDPVLVERDFAVVGGYSRGAYIFDITNPEETVLARFVECRQPRNDVAVKRFTDDVGTARTLIALTSHGTPCTQPPLYGNGPGGVAIFDVTDPYAFEELYGVRSPGVHNFTFHPTAMAGYVWTGALPGGIDQIPIVDLRDLDRPRLLPGPDTVGGPHDGEFSPDGNRAYVAQENNYAIWNTEDPFAPVLISTTPNLGTYAHGVFPTPDGSMMVTNNESLALGGFFVSGTGVCPGEGLAFYDTTVEQAPVGPLGYYVPPVRGRTIDHRACTSHFGRVAPNGVVMTIGWYVLGARVVDFSDPSQPREIGAAVLPKGDSPDLGSEVWSAKFYRGPYLYTGDLGRGFDVFRWTGNSDCPAPWQEGWESSCEPDARILTERR